MIPFKPLVIVLAVVAVADLVIGAISRAANPIGDGWDFRIAAGMAEGLTREQAILKIQREDAEFKRTGISSWGDSK